jgi:hypothetical protein
MKRRPKVLELALVLSLAAVGVGCMAELTDDTDTGSDPVCGDYGYGETTCDEVAANLDVCCTEGLEDQCGDVIISFENDCDGYYADDFDGMLDHCSCDDCEETESDECDEFRSCVSACGGDFYLPGQ